MISSAFKLKALCYKCNFIWILSFNKGLNEYSIHPKYSVTLNSYYHPRIFTSLFFSTSCGGYKTAHYENTPIQICWNFYHHKMKFLDKKFWHFFHISAQNIDFGHSLQPPRQCSSIEYHDLCFEQIEPPWWGCSNEYPQSMFWAEIRKIMYTLKTPVLQYKSEV